MHIIIHLIKIINYTQLPQEDKPKLLAYNQFIDFSLIVQIWWLYVYFLICWVRACKHCYFQSYRYLTYLNMICRVCDFSCTLLFEYNFDSKRSGKIDKCLHTHRCSWLLFGHFIWNSSIMCETWHNQVTYLSFLHRSGESRSKITKARSRESFKAKISLWRQISQYGCFSEGVYAAVVFCMRRFFKFYEKNLVCINSSRSLEHYAIYIYRDKSMRLYKSV